MLAEDAAPDAEPELTLLSSEPPACAACGEPALVSTIARILSKVCS